ncbi:hypothetical protein HORM4_1050010 [Vibrio harveyi]|nr:hypothetical protein HORM4_1050010 [Vibrio harveyi]
MLSTEAYRRIEMRTATYSSHTHSLHYRIVSDLHNLLIKLAFLYAKKLYFSQIDFHQNSRVSICYFARSSRK